MLEELRLERLVREIGLGEDQPVRRPSAVEAMDEPQARLGEVAVTYSRTTASAVGRFSRGPVLVSSRRFIDHQHAFVPWTRLSGASEAFDAAWGARGLVDAEGPLPQAVAKASSPARGSR